MTIKKLFSAGIIFLFSSIFTFADLDLAFVGHIIQSPNPTEAGGATEFKVRIKNNSGSPVTSFIVAAGVRGSTPDLYWQVIGSNRSIEEANGEIIETFQIKTKYLYDAEGNILYNTVWFKLYPPQIVYDPHYIAKKIEKPIHFGALLADLKVEVKHGAIFTDQNDSLKLSIQVSNANPLKSSPCRLVLINAYNNAILRGWDIPSISMDSNWNTDYIWKVDCGATLKIEVDALKTVAESNENNNIWSKKMVCVPKKPINTKYQHGKKLH